MSRFDLDKRALLQITGAGLAMAGTPALAKGSRPKPAVHAPALIDRQLNTGWSFRQADSDAWLPATVPGTVHTDLLANKKIEDPFYRTNEHDQQWIDKKDWEYRTAFEIDPATFARQHIELFFEGLDTYANVYVNEVLVLSADNMFRTWTAAIKDHVIPGHNALRILFRSPITEGLKQLAALGLQSPGHQ